MADLTDRLFAYVQIDRTGKAAKARASASKSFDNLIQPLGVRLNPEEKKLNPGLAHLVATVSAERASNYSFIPFPMHELRENLLLTPPRKVNTYVASQRTLNAAAAAASAASSTGKEVKEKVKREPGAGGKGGNPAWRPGFLANKTTRAQMQEEMGHYLNDDDDGMGMGIGMGMGMGMGMSMGMDMDDSQQSRKRERLTSDGNSLSDLGAPEEIMSSAEIVLPRNFFAVINGLFEQFWSMEFDDAAVSQAFFAKIDNFNCRHYGLEAFAETSMSLSVIRDRIEATRNGTTSGAYRRYISPEDFYSDFRSMFENIFAFFPPQSAPQLKAVELNALFHQRWEVARAAFVYG